MASTSVIPTADTRANGLGKVVQSVSRAHVLTALLLICAVIQVLSATFVRSDFATPNASTHIARYMLETGTYGLNAWHRLKGTDDASLTNGPMRMFQLPAEPLYQYVSFRVLPAYLQRYCHIPFVLLFVLAVFLVADAVLGRTRAIVTALIVTLHPFIIVHGPVWDDATMGAACEWSCLALLLTVQRKHLGRYVLLFVCAAVAALARTQSQLFLGILGLLIVAVPRLRSHWRKGLALLAGVVLAVAAWGIRNYSISGAFVTGTTHDGITLYESNYPHEREALIRTGQTEGLNNLYMQRDFAYTATLTEAAANRFFTKRGVDVILHRPHVAWLRDAVFKLVASLLGFHPELAMSNVHNLLQVLPNGLLLVASVFGAMRLPRSRFAIPAMFALAVALMTCLTFAMLLIGPVGFRYQMSMLGVYSIFAASAVTQKDSVGKRRS